MLWWPGHFYVFFNFKIYVFTTMYLPSLVLRVQAILLSNTYRQTQTDLQTVRDAMQGRNHGFKVGGSNFPFPSPLLPAFLPLQGA